MGAILPSMDDLRQKIEKALSQFDSSYVTGGLNLDLLQEGGVVIDELRAIGGGARSDLWLQLKADVTGIPVVAPEITEAAAWGAAMLAGHGAGAFPDLAHTAARTVRLTRRFEPDAARSATYAERFALYREVYPAVKAIHHRLVDNVTL